jgi:hypothetical protein
VNTWVRRGLIAGACSAALLVSAAGLAAAAPGGSAAIPPVPADTAQPATTAPGEAEPTGAEPIEVASTDIGPTGTVPTQTPTVTPTAPPTTDDPVTGTPSAPHDTEITRSVAVPAGGGGAQVGGLPERPPQRDDNAVDPGSASGAGAGGPGTAGLAATGVSLTVPLAIATVFLLGGTAAVLAGRRRCPAHPRTTGCASVPEGW